MPEKQCGICRGTKEGVTFEDTKVFVCLECFDGMKVKEGTAINLTFNSNIVDAKSFCDTIRKSNLMGDINGNKV